MSLVIEAPPVPLRTDEHGVIRVGKTRLPLDTVVYAFNQGASPEEIVMSYSTLDLLDVYAVVNYYVHNRAEVDDYIRGREAEAALIREENEKRFPQEGIRARLLARRQKQNGAWAMLKFAVDENFNMHIVNGVLRRFPNMDIVRVRDAGLEGEDDPTVLEWAASEGRVLLTHDVNTVTAFAYERVAQGLPMPGVFEVSLKVAISVAIEEILLLAECSIEGEWEAQVNYLPLK